MTTHTITAIFDDAGAMETARRKLAETGIPAADIHTSGANTTHADGLDHDKSFWESLKGFFIPDEDRATYAEGVRRGGFLLTARVNEPLTDEAIRVLDQNGAVDIDERAKEWQTEGWTAAGASHSSQSPVAATATNESASQPVAGTAANQSAAQSAAAPVANQSDNATQEERVPIVEERVRVGKRDVNRGSVRVRSYIVEQPVHEDVQLREERVEVERRPVTGSDARSASDQLQERTIELSETVEEPVVQKDAVVTEEVVVKKFTGERTQGVDETVRHTEVDVDDSRSDKAADTPARRLDSASESGARPH
jgi:uncharacterized protein (TIGR02271 family)